MTVSFILPTYNEKGNIIKIIEKIIKSLGHLSYKYEIAVVDDNSPDKTGEITRKYFSKNKNIKVHVRRNERGFASAIYYGIKKTTGDVIIVMDTDFSHDPSRIPVLLTEIKKCDIVIGSRYAQDGGGENKLRYWMSKLYNIYLRFILGINISDFLFGYFCIKREFLLKNKLLNKEIFTGFGDYFIRLAYYINQAGGTFLEIPAFYKSRTYGESKSDLIDMFFTYTKTSLLLLIRNISSPK